MNPINFVLYAIGASLIFMCIFVLVLLAVEILEMLGYKVPDWIKKLKE